MHTREETAMTHENGARGARGWPGVHLETSTETPTRRRDRTSNHERATEVGAETAIGMQKRV